MVCIKFTSNYRPIPSNGRVVFRSDSVDTSGNLRFIKYYVVYFQHLQHPCTIKSILRANWVTLIGSGISIFRYANLV